MTQDQIIFKVPAEKKRALKIQCAARGVTMTDVMAQAVAGILAGQPVEVTNLVAALREVEWLPESIEWGEFEGCPWCDNFSHRGHADDCKRQTALAPFDTKEPE